MADINWSNVTSLTEIAQQANVSTDGAFWAGILYMLWLCLLFIFLAGVNVYAALIASMFLALIVSLLLAFTNLVSFWHALVFFAGLIIVMLIVTYNRRPETA